MRKLSLLCFIAVSATGIGQVVPIGQWGSPTGVEGYETQPVNTFLSSIAIFGGTASANQSSAGQGLLVTTGWSFFSNIAPHGGARFMGGAGVNYEFVFSNPVARFGGYFGTNADVGGATATFYDSSNQQIGGPLAVGAPNGGQWQWDGWQYLPGISRISITASNQWGGFIMSDDLQYDAVPEPASMIVLGLGLAIAARRRSAR